MVDELLASPLETQWAAERTGKKLDLACGTNLREGYIGVDSVPLDVIHPNGAPETYDTYIQHDLYDLPWPFEDNSIAAVYSSHFVEHIPHYHPDWGPERDGWWVWFEELYRVLEDGGVAEFIHPFSRSDRAFWDPTHTRYIHYQTWFYMNRDHRIQLGVNHYAPDINFDILNIQAMHEPTFLEGKSAQVVEFARSFYFNPTDDLFVVLQAVK